MVQPVQDVTLVLLVNIDEAVCNLPAVRGPCVEHTLSYFYDNRQGVCKEFVYSGCEGNGNRFSSMTACQHVCIEGKGRAAEPEDRVRPKSKSPSNRYKILTFV